MRKPRFAKLKASQSIETISFDEAMELFKLPIALGDYEGQEVSVNIGRFGPYVKYGEQFISIPKGRRSDGNRPEQGHPDHPGQTGRRRPIGFYDDKPITKGKAGLARISNGTTSSSMFPGHMFSTC